jgi:hypothetical protein
LFGALSLVSTYGYLNSIASETELVVDEPEGTLSRWIVGREYSLDFRIHNRSGRVVRIIGLGIT